MHGGVLQVLRRRDVRATLLTTSSLLPYFEPFWLPTLPLTSTLQKRTQSSTGLEIPAVGSLLFALLHDRQPPQQARMSSLPPAARPPSVHSTTSSSSTMPPSSPSLPSSPEKVARPSPRDPSPSGTLAEGGGGPTAGPANPEKEAAEAYLVEFDSETDEYHPWSLPIWRKWAAVLIVSSSSLCVCVFNYYFRVLAW